VTCQGDAPQRMKLLLVAAVAVDLAQAMVRSARERGKAADAFDWERIGAKLITRGRVGTVILPPRTVAVPERRLRVPPSSLVTELWRNIEQILSHNNRGAVAALADARDAVARAMANVAHAQSGTQIAIEQRLKTALDNAERATAGLRAAEAADTIREALARFEARPPDEPPTIADILAAGRVVGPLVCTTASFGVDPNQQLITTMSVLEIADYERCTGAVEGAFEATSLAARGDYAGAVVRFLGVPGLSGLMETAIVPQRLAREARAGDRGEQIHWLDRARASLAVVADLGTAQDSESFEAALDRFAAPVGTWRRKHEAEFGISLQGYAGMLGAYEFEPRRRPELAPGWAVSPTLSVGVQLHFRFFGCSEVRSFLYFPIIDVGNVASVRLANQSSDRLLEVDATPDVAWAQLFAPGVYWGISIGRSPFDVAIGLNYIPALRNPQGTAQGDAPVLRFGLSLAVDVTILPLL